MSQRNGSETAAGVIEEDLATLLTGIRRHLHQHPEIGLREFETSAYIRSVLESHGLEVHGPVAGTGLYVDITGRSAGPVVAYRADIDALPTPDEKTVPYRSQVDGVAHLCGHDGHTAIAIGLILLLNKRRDDLQGTVRVFFQPNEEGIPSGAPMMIRDGVMDGVKAVFASHVDPTLATGVFGLISGPATASADRFRITVSGGSTGHSARPHQSVDTVWVLTQIMNTLYQLVGRLSDARNTAVISICRIHGGEAFNVIPASVEMGGTVRCISNEGRALIRERMEQISHAIGETYGARVDVDFDMGSPPVINDSALVSVVRSVIADRLGPDAIFEIPRPSMGGEDFAHYVEHAPCMLLRVGTCNGPSTARPLHDSAFDLDEAALPLAADILADTMTHLLRCVADEA
jgi:amidohydrolase